MGGIYSAQSGGGVGERVLDNGLPSQLERSRFLRGCSPTILAVPSASHQKRESITRTSEVTYCVSLGTHDDTRRISFVTMAFDKPFADGRNRYDHRWALVACCQLVARQSCRGFGRQTAEESMSTGCNQFVTMS